LTSKKATPSPAVLAGAEIELTFDDLLSNGQAVGRAGGMAVFVFGPLPGERARVRIVAVKPKYAVGEAIELLDASDERAEPFCPVFGTCGGCQVQHLSYPAQLAWKRDIVRSALQRIGGIADAQVSPTIGMLDPRRYRNKMSLVAERSAAGFGFYKQRSHDIVPIEHCPIVQAPLDDYIGRLIRLRRDGDTAGALANVRHVVARTARASQESILTLTTAEPSKAAERAADVLLSSLPGAVGITNSFDLSSENAILGRKHKVLAGRAQIEEVIAGIRFRISATSFFQVNVEIVERLFDFMRPRIGPARRIVDLYCGSGTFALFFAKAGSHVLGVEESQAAVREAHANATLNGLADRALFRCGRVAQALQQPQCARALGGADLVFLDPPRKGSDPQTLAAIAGANVPNVWYLSCDPATLARDLKFLMPKGYDLPTVQPFDMFPQTGHVESLAMLARRENR